MRSLTLGHVTWFCVLNVLYLGIAAVASGIGAVRNGTDSEQVAVGGTSLADFVIGALVLSRLDNASFKPILGGIILSLTLAQLVRMRWPELIPPALSHSRPRSLLAPGCSGKHLETLGRNSEHSGECAGECFDGKRVGLFFDSRRARSAGRH